jgi:hypothetical protein
MNGKRGAGGENPWIKKPKPDDEPDESGAQTQPPPSPWSQEVPPPPVPSSRPGTGDDPVPGAGSGAGSGTGATFGGGPAWETSAAWGDKVSPPSLRRPVAEAKRRRFPPLLLPIGAGIAAVALLAVALSVLVGRGDEAGPPVNSPSAPVQTSSSSAPGQTPSPSSYTPPPNAIAVAFGVSVVPLDGWSVLAKETQGKQLVTYAPNGEPRAFFWVRQRENVSAKEYMLRIVEGETSGETTQLGKERSLTCPRDILVECFAISYTSVSKGVKVKGFVETYRRKDGVVTGIDFRTRSDYAPKAEADAELMRKSVLDSF